MIGVMETAHRSLAVIPAKAGIHLDVDLPLLGHRSKMDSGVRRNDGWEAA